MHYRGDGLESRADDRGWRQRDCKKRTVPSPLAQIRAPGQRILRSADWAPPREMRTSELAVNDEPNEPPGDRRGYEPPARAEKNRPARQHPTHEPNPRIPDRPNLRDSRAATGDGAAPRAFANVAARSCQDQ